MLKREEAIEILKDIIAELKDYKYFTLSKKAKKVKEVIDFLEEHMADDFMKQSAEFFTKLSERDLEMAKEYLKLMDCYCLMKSEECNKQQRINEDLTHSIDNFGKIF